MEKIKMGWNNLSSWLRGGIIGLILAIIFSLYMISQPSCVGLNSDGTSSCPIGLNMFLDNLTAFSPSIIITLISLFIVGAIIGWIVGKIRNNKMASQVKSKKGVKK